MSGPISDRALWYTGQDVNFALPREHQGLRPSNESFKAAARALGITQALAKRAWYFYTFQTVGV